METERLYYRDAYQAQFTAQVVARDQIDGRPAVALERTAFFPTSGGQPHDLGSLNGIAVRDVQETGGLIWHLLDRPLPGDRVEGQLDWRRRWDHMQNHSGQHILSQAFILTAEALTVGWHLSPGSVTVDLDRSDLLEADLERAEQVANGVVQENRPIGARLVAEADLPSLALRKQPDLDGPLRIVEIEAFDRVACSGTHVASTAQVGLIKILRSERRGSETRIHFACGGRAVADYGRKHRLVRDLASHFTRSEDEIMQAVERLSAEAQATHKRLRSAQSALVSAEASRLLAGLPPGPAPRLAHGLYPDWEPEQIKDLAATLRRHPGIVVAVAGGEPPRLAVARSDDLEVDAGRLLRMVLDQVGGRGGGRPDFAQGSAPTHEAAAAAIAQLKEYLGQGR